MNPTANANLFSRLFDGLDDPNRLAIETADGTRISYGDLIARAGLADPGASPGHPCHAFPVICHANRLRCFLKGVFANPARAFRPFSPLGDVA